MPDELNPRKGVRVRRRRRLHLVAANQGGCFSVAQAAQAGLDRRARHHHLSYGNWRSTAAPGVYRLTGWPVDDDEALHAWLVWAGPGAALTSWTTLLVEGLIAPLAATALGAAATASALPPAHIVRPRPTSRRDRIDLDPVGSGHVVLHSSWAPHHTAHLTRGLIVRPIEEALSIALQTATGAQVARLTALVDRLLDDGRIDLFDLVEVAQAAHCGRMVELVWPRLRARHRRAS